MRTLHSFLDNLAAAGSTYGWGMDALALGVLLWALTAGYEQVRNGDRLAGPFLGAIDIVAQPGRQRDLGHGVGVCGDHPLTALVTTEGEQLREEAMVEHGWVAAMVTPTRHDDPAGRERPYQCMDHLHSQIRLVGHTDQGGLRRLRKRPQADGDRSADALFRMRVLNRRQRKAGERIHQASVSRDH